MKIKITNQKPKTKSVQDLQDEIFKKMTPGEKLSLLDSFFKFGKELQSLNNRKKMK